MSAGKRKHISLSLSGESYSKIYGPDIFEIVPFLILDNSIKYCVENYTIKVSFLEDDSKINTTIETIGPKIDPDEIGRIFDYGFRGRHAVQSGKEGNGIGLSVLRRIVEEGFEGSVDVRQDGQLTDLGGVPYRKTWFYLAFPKL